MGLKYCLICVIFHSLSVVSILSFTVFNSIHLIQNYRVTELNCHSFQIYMFLGHITLTFGASFIVSLLFESPMMGLEKALLRNDRNIFSVLWSYRPALLRRKKGLTK